MNGQIGAVTGKRKRLSYEDIINAENAYLPQRVQARKDKEFADKTFAFNEQQAEIDKNLAWEAGHEGRKQGNRANNLGYANLGINALGNAGALSGLYDSIMGFF